MPDNGVRQFAFVSAGVLLAVASSILGWNAIVKPTQSQQLGLMNSSALTVKRDGECSIVRCTGTMRSLAAKGVTVLAFRCSMSGEFRASPERLQLAPGQVQQVHFVLRQPLDETNAKADERTTIRRFQVCPIVAGEMALSPPAAAWDFGEIP